ncbi:MAG: tyrosine-protein phosphatase [Nitrospirae bacterium]|nr:tyrosine-protein phosphatase [Nitrospirota bacterium]
MRYTAHNKFLRIWFPTILLIFSLVLASFPLLIDSPASAGEPNRPPQWAVPMKVQGVSNLHKINDNLYRSAQPTEEGMKNLEKMGIKTIINLRAFHSDKDKLKGTALLNNALSVKTWHIEDEDVIRVLKIISEKENSPFLIHCQHGADRTGAMSAMYRIVVQGWSKDEAIREMVDGNYGFHSVWSNIIEYVKNVDVEKIQQELAK